MKAIVARIWALWAMVFFIATMAIAIWFYLPCFFLSDPAKARWHRNVSRVWMTIFLYATGCPFTVKGQQHFSNLENCVVVCNHNSLMDIPISTPFMPRANKTIAKKSFTKVPVFGWIYAFGSVLVDRNSDESRRKSYDEMKKVLFNGMDMVIYPEGTRNKTSDPLKTFYDGAFKLAVDTRKPIIPTLIFNTRKVLPASKAFYMLPAKIEMHFLPPVLPGNMSSKELKEKVFRIMWDYYEAHQ